MRLKYLLLTTVAEIEKKSLSKQCQSTNNSVEKFPREGLSAEDAEKIHALATKITFKMADCGPEIDSTIDGNPTMITRIKGFQAKKARDTIEEMIWDFLLRGY